MIAGRTGILLLLLVSFLGSDAECAADGPTAADSAPRAPGKAAEVSLLFSRQAKRQKLTPERLDLILRTARANVGERDVWFVGVEILYPLECRATVYFTPERSSPRVRSGSCFVISLDRGVEKGDVDRITWMGRDEYFVVSTPGREFGPGNRPPPVPAATAHTPFLRPWYSPTLLATGRKAEDERKVAMSDERAVGLVDAARAAFGEPDPDLPLCHIGVKDRDTFFVA